MASLIMSMKDGWALVFFAVAMVRDVVAFGLAADLALLATAADIVRRYQK